MTRAGATESNAAALKKEAAYWDRVAKDAPAEIRDSMNAAAHAADKLATGDTSVATQQAFAKGISAYATWFTTNCKIKP